jgi:hypothetical protein
VKYIRSEKRSYAGEASTIRLVMDAFEFEHNVNTQSDETWP